jgi:hypothetical protein
MAGKFAPVAQGSIKRGVAMFHWLRKILSLKTEPKSKPIAGVTPNKEFRLTANEGNFHSGLGGYQGMGYQQNYNNSGGQGSNGS